MRLDVQRASFAYASERTVFADVSVRVEAGQIVTVLGPNGAGKSTLIKCLAGLLDLGGGKILLDGRDARHMRRRDRARRIGYVPQDTVATLNFTVLEMVLMGRAPHVGLLGTPSANDLRLARDALRDVGADHLAEKPYSRISGGEEQLVLIARALAAQPEMLLLDEPASHLDLRNQMRILQTLERLARRQGLSVLMATHFPDHALRIADTAVLMDLAGRAHVGPAERTLTESILSEVYGLPVRLLSYEDDGQPCRVAVPLQGRGE